METGMIRCFDLSRSSREIALPGGPSVGAPWINLGKGNNGPGGGDGPERAGDGASRTAHLKSRCILHQGCMVNVERNTQNLIKYTRASKYYLIVQAG